MPEGDSLVRAAHRLRPVLVGRALTAAQLRVPRHATADLVGWTVTAVIPRAKYLLMRLMPPSSGDPADPRGLTLLSHLKMEGRWRVCAPGERWPAPAHRVRAVLETDDVQVFGIELGLLELLPTAEEDTRLGFLGPDLLDPAWTPASLRAAVAALRSRPALSIGAALLDQRLVAGLGNIYRCEALLLAGIDPHRPVAEVEDLPGLVTLARDLMRANVPPAVPAEGAARRTTGVRPDPDAPFGVRVLVPHAPAAWPAPPAAHGTAAPESRGRARRPAPSYWVYGHDRQPCLRCGGPVTRGELGAADGLARRLWWCRRCQS